MSKEQPTDPALAEIESIYDALDRGDPAAALALARRGQAEAPDDPVIHLLAGVALLELERPAEAASELARSLELDPDDAETRARYALALFRSCRFEQSRGEAQRALELDPGSPDAHWVWALLLERGGREDEAETHFREAASLDPDRFPPPLRLDRAAFEAEVRRAIDRLPEAHRRHLEAVVISVEDLPSDAVLMEEDPPFDPENLLGLFVGLAQDQRSYLSAGGELPSRILIFKKNLERLALEREDLLEEIAVTVYHELGHYLGLDEDDLERLDFA